MCGSQPQYDLRLGLGQKGLAPLTFIQRSPDRVWGPPLLLSNWYCGLLPTVTDRGTKLSAFLHPEPFSSVVTTRSAGTQRACDVCRSGIKQWVERRKCGCVKRRLARHLNKLNWRIDSEGHYKHQTPNKGTKIWFYSYLSCLRNSPHRDTAASQLHATVSAVCSHPSYRLAWCINSTYLYSRFSALRAHIDSVLM